MDDVESPFFPWEGRIIIITNIHPTISPTDLRDILLCCGKILRVDIEINSEGKRTGVAYVEFYSAEYVQYVLLLNSNNFFGVHLELNLASHPPKQLIQHYIIKPSQRSQNITFPVESITDQQTLINIYPKHMRRRTRKLISDQHVSTKNEGEEEEVEDQTDSYSLTEDYDSEYDQ